MNDPAGQCKAFVKYSTPIDRLLIVYAITQQSVNDPNAAAFFSQVTLACGCQCAAKPPVRPSVIPVSGCPGTCREVHNTAVSYGCDFMGDHWCETETASKWIMSGGSGGACTKVASTISRPVSRYAPSAEFNRLPEP